MTEGCIAIGTPTSWQGIFVPCDAMPERVGLELRTILYNETDLHAFGRRLLRYRTWSEFRAMEIGGTDTFAGMRMRKILSIFPDPLFLAHIYIIDPYEHLLFYMQSIEKDFDKAFHASVPSDKCRYPYMRPDGVWQYEKYACEHELVHTINLRTDDPGIRSVSGTDVLKLKLRESDPGYELNRTIKTYLIDILKALWHDPEAFSGKYGASGNSSWTYDFCYPLVRNKLIRGEIDKYGCLKNIDEVKAHALIDSAIKCLGE